MLAGKLGRLHPIYILHGLLNWLRLIRGRQATSMLCNMFSLLVLSPEDVLPTVYLCTNKLAPDHKNMDFNIGGSLVTAALKEACGTNKSTLKALNDSLGDLGDVAQLCRQTQKLLAVVFLFSGSRLYRLQKPRESPLARIFQVIVASFRKASVEVPCDKSLLYEAADQECCIKGSRKLEHTNELTHLQISTLFRDIWSIFDDIGIKSLKHNQGS